MQVGSVDGFTKGLVPTRTDVNTTDVSLKFDSVDVSKLAFPNTSKTSSCRQWYPVVIKSGSKALKFVSGYTKLAGKRNEAKLASTVRNPLLFLDSCRNLYRGKTDLRLRHVKTAVTQPMWCLRQAYYYDYSQLVEDTDFRVYRNFSYSCLDVLTLTIMPLIILRQVGEQLLDYLSIEDVCHVAASEIGQYCVHGADALNQLVRHMAGLSEQLRACCRVIGLLAVAQVFIGLAYRKPEPKWMMLAAFDLAVAIVEATRSFFYFAQVSGVDMKEPVDNDSWLYDATTAYELLGTVGAVLGLLSIFVYYKVGDTPEHQYEVTSKHEKCS